MKNSYYLNSSLGNMSSVVSLDLDTSWAARSWDLSQWYQLQDSYKLESEGKEVLVVTMMNGVIQKVNAWPEETGKMVKENLELVLAQNPGWSAAYLDLVRMLRRESPTSADSHKK